jgi:hypothetical protein
VFTDELMRTEIRLKGYDNFFEQGGCLLFFSLFVPDHQRITIKLNKYSFCA